MRSRSQRRNDLSRRLKLSPDKALASIQRAAERMGYTVRRDLNSLICTHREAGGIVISVFPGEVTSLAVANLKEKIRRHMRHYTKPRKQLPPVDIHHRRRLKF